MRYAHKGDRLADVAASLMVALVARTPLPLDAAVLARLARVSVASAVVIMDEANDAAEARRTERG